MSEEKGTHTTPAVPVMLPHGDPLYSLAEVVDHLATLMRVAEDEDALVAVNKAWNAARRARDLVNKGRQARLF